MLENPSLLSAFWLTAWLILNVGTTLLNKGIVELFKFRNPTTLSFIHMAVSTILTFTFSRASPKEKSGDEPTSDEQSINKRRLFRVTLLSWILALNIILGNKSLTICSVSFVQVVRAIIPIITMVFSRIFLGEQFSWKQIMSCMIVCAGVVLTCFGMINLTVEGLLITLAGCFLSSLKSIITSQMLGGSFKMAPLELLLYSSPFTSIDMFFLIFTTKEYSSYTSDTRYEPSITCTLCLLLSGVLAFALNIANFEATQHTSALTVTIGGCVKQVITIALSVVLFDKKLTLMNTIGIIITTVGSAIYSVAPKKEGKDCDKNEDKEVTLANQNEAYFLRIP